MTRTSVRAALRANLAIVTVLWVLAVSRGIDLVMDLGRRATLFHAFVEGSAIIAAAVGVALGARRLRTALHEAQDLREQARTLFSTLDITRREAERWRREARQQARSVYRKGGLSGRHDLAAFFLEDLLAPRPASAVESGAAHGA